jgi:pectate lyase
MIETFRIGINFSGFTPIPPEPEPPITYEQYPIATVLDGWASVYNGGIGVTGGKGGTVYEIDNWTDFRATLLAANSETTGNTNPEIFRYTGPNVTIDDTAINLNNLRNKTIECSNGQNFHGGEFRFINCENIIVRNISRTGPYTTRTWRTANNKSTSLDYFTPQSSLGMIFDHCQGDGGNVFNEEEGIDGWIDIGNGSDLISIQKCKIWGVNRGGLWGNHFGDSGWENNIGKMRISNSVNWFKNVINRAFQYRWGLPNSRNNYHTWDITKPSTTYTILIRYYAQLLSQGDYFESGRIFLEDQALNASPDDFTRGMETLLSGAISENTFIDTDNYSASNPSANRYNFINLRPENVLWHPDTTPNWKYGIPLMTPEEAKDYVIANAGANLTLASYTLTRSILGSGTVNVGASTTWTNGDEITLIATPSSGHTFKEWRYGTSSGDLMSTSATFNFVMPDVNATVVAIFEPIV